MTKERKGGTDYSETPALSPHLQTKWGPMSGREKDQGRARNLRQAQTSTTTPPKFPFSVPHPSPTPSTSHPPAGTCVRKLEFIDHLLCPALCRVL